MMMRRMLCASRGVGPSLLQRCAPSVASSKCLLLAVPFRRAFSDTPSPTSPLPPPGGEGSQPLSSADIKNEQHKTGPPPTPSSVSDLRCARIEIKTPFQAHRCDPLPQYGDTTNKEMLEYYRTMTRMRRLEMAADQLYKQRMIRGFCHLYDGQEAVAVGIEAAITKEDSVITAYRDHCNMMARGGTPLSIMAELLGKEAGCSKGKGGSMHMYYRERNFYGGNGIVGAQVPLGTGLAFASKYRNQDRVSVTMMGDGAANQGQVYESFNLAALHKLPVVYFIENNRYGMGTAVTKAAASPDLYTRGDYIRGMRMDGMDVLAVREAVKWAVELCRKGEGPVLLEAVTYRYSGHSMSDPGTAYRTRDEIMKVRHEKDPIERVRNIILSQQWSTEKELKAIDREARNEMAKVVEEAMALPEPHIDAMFEDIYRDFPPPFIRGTQAHLSKINEHHEQEQMATSHTEHTESVGV